MQEPVRCPYSPAQPIGAVRNKERQRLITYKHLFRFFPPIPIAVISDAFSNLISEI
jgi:hypothetical protein